MTCSVYATVADTPQFSFLLPMGFAAWCDDFLFFFSPSICILDFCFSNPGHGRRMAGMYSVQYILKERENFL